VVEPDDRVRRRLGELSVEGGDLGPVGGIDVTCGRVASGDGCLDLVRAGVAAAQCCTEEIDTLTDGRLVPSAAVLILQRNEFPV